MEGIIDSAASGLGNAVSFLADSGILFIIFALLWAAFAVVLIGSQGSLNAAWQWVRDLPLILQGVIWLLFLPVMLGLWIWETTWPIVLRVVLVAGLAGWNLLVFPKPWR